uniref:PITH domain-containing protein n=1 Tax=Timspurckia oligopyrenoides TaxID=708627 RepID=A0A7S1EPN0_9RHOD|mmetsp:Transcript_1003/g.1902  ORF Transcript_1003/g.1902 Transcript_1003/m.1902 type:complete len:219 (+) Transcript_1003:102-758(+)
MSGCGHSHHENCDHGSEAGDDIQKDSLFPAVDLEKCVALNCLPPNHLPKNVIKPVYMSNNNSNSDIESHLHLESDSDHEILIRIQFTNPVHIRSLLLAHFGDNSAPKTVKLYTNIISMDFSTASTTTPTQIIELVAHNPHSKLTEYPTKITKFKNINSVWMYFCENCGGDRTKIEFIGLKGTATKYKREAVSAVYEIQPQKASGNSVSNQHSNSSNIM